MWKASIWKSWRREADIAMQIQVEPARPDSVDAMQLIAELDQYLNDLPYTPESRHAYSIEKLLNEGVDFFVAFVDGKAAGCGGVKLFKRHYAEVKRMYVRPSFRGVGLGKAILNHLAQHAIDGGINVLRLETGIYQTEAIGLYERWGFQRRPPFGEYKEHPLSLYFEKRIA